jgi:CRP-like cAMP-binding protein/Zn-dependent protease
VSTAARLPDLGSSGPGAPRAGADVWSALGERVDPAQWRPVLTGDIEMATFPVAGGGAYVMVANPRDQVHYRFTPAEAGVLPLLDGRRSIGEIVVDRLGGTGEFDVTSVAELVALLEQGGFLATPYVDVPAAVQAALHPPTLGSRASGVLRTLSVEWSGAERLVRFLYLHVLRQLFTRVGLILAALVTVAGALAFGAVVSRHVYGIQNRHFGVVFAILFTLDLMIVFVHELGRAAVLVHYGRRVKSAGFQIYFGTPAFFVESADSLMLPRGRRIVQAAAGAGVEVIVTSIASIALWAFPTGPAGQVLYQFVIINYLVLFLNLVPFLELDGYWILSDALRQPDLRPESLAFVRCELWRKLWRRQRLTRREVGLAVFGLAGVEFTVAAFVSAWFFWRRVFGNTVAAMWDGGVGGKLLLLLVLVSLLGGLVFRAVFAVSRAAGAALGARVRAIRFRFQGRWRVEAAELLDASGAFGDVPVEVLNELAGRVRVRTGPRGGVVLRQGEVADDYYLVRSGRFEVVEERGVHGQARVLRTIGRGEGFGEYGLLRAARRTATVRACTRGELYTLDKGSFERLLAGRAVVAGFATTWQQSAELAALPPFSHLGPDELRLLAARGSWLNVAPGEVLMSQGEPGDAFYVIESGQLDVIENGMRVRTCGPGEYVGEIALLFDTPGTATVQTTTSAHLYRLDRDGFTTFVAARFRQGTLRTNVLVERDWNH